MKYSDLGNVYELSTKRENVKRTLAELGEATSFSLDHKDAAGTYGARIDGDMTPELFALLSARLKAKLADVEAKLSALDVKLDAPASKTAPEAAAAAAAAMTDNAA